MFKLKKWGMALAVTLLFAISFLPLHASAAAGDVIGLELEQEGTIHLYVEENTEQLKLLATIEGSSSKKDVTNEAVWTSSNSKAVKVEKGFLTPVAKGEATITAKYKGFSVNIKVVSDYLFKELRLSESGVLEYKLGHKGVKLEAFAIEEDEMENDVTLKAQWSTSNASVLNVSGGELTFVGTGKATVTAKYKGLSASVQIQVSSPYTKLELDPAAEQELLVGSEDTAIQAIATLENGTQENVSQEAEWKSSNTNVVTVKEGKLTPLAVGKATISANYLGVSAQTTVIVRSPYEVLLLSPAQDWTLFVNEEPVQVNAFVMNSLDDRKDVTLDAVWTSSNTLAVTVQDGRIAPKVAGTATIKVTYRGLSKEFKVTVQPTITKIEAALESLELFKGEVVNVPAVYAFTLDERKLDFSKEVEWISSDEEIMTVENGKLTAKKAGTAQLTAKMRGLTYTVDVTVEEKVLLLLPAQESISLITGTEVPLPHVLAVRENGVEEDVTDKIVWTLTGASAVIVDKQIKGYVKGNVRLTGTYLNQSIRIPITIEQEIVNIVVEPNEIELNIKKSKSIKVTGYYANGTKVNLSSKIDWVSSNPNVASIKSRSVKGEQEGQAVLTGSYQDIPLEVNVYVVPKVKKLEASEKKVQLAIGQTKQIEITALYDTNHTQKVTQDVVWTTSKSSVAKVVDGKIEAVGKGSATIRATLDKKTVTIRVTVK